MRGLALKLHFLWWQRWRCVITLFIHGRSAVQPGEGGLQAALNVYSSKVHAVVAVTMPEAVLNQGSPHLVLEVAWSSQFSARYVSNRHC